MPSAFTHFIRNTTVRVVCAALFLVGMLLFFQKVPTALRWPVRLLLGAASLWLLWTTVRALTRNQFTVKKVLFILMVVCFYYVCLALVCHVFITIMSQRDDRLTTRGMTSLSEGCRRGIAAMIDDKNFNQFSPTIGWVPRPGHHSESYTVNAQGIRGSREYVVPAPEPAKRVLCMGDSFTFGIAVDDDECYPAHAERLRPGTEWINLGVPGGCLVQSFQRYQRDASKFGGKRVVVGFMTNDAQRTVNAFRPFLNADSGCPFTKPFAKFSDGKFSIEPNPYDSLEDFRTLLAHESTELSKLRQLDYLTWSGMKGPDNPVARTALYLWESFRVDRNLDGIFSSMAPSRMIDRLVPVDPYGSSIWQTSSPGFKAICAMFETYRQTIIADQREPLFVIIPGPLDINNHVKGFPCQYTTLIDYFQAHGFPFIDFLPVLLSKHKSDLSEDALFVRNHYRGHINKELAAEIIHAARIP